MRLLAVLVIAGIMIGLLYLHTTHEGGLSGVWDEVTNQDTPSVEIEYQPITP